MFPITYHGKTLPTYRAHSIQDKDVDIIWNIPAEVPVAFVYNRRNYAIMMAIPDNLIDFAVGFSLSERIVKSTEDILSVDIYHRDNGVDLRIKITKDAIEKFDIIQRRRNMVGSASCGLCGLENADTLFASVPLVSNKKLKLDPKILMESITKLRSHQTLNDLTKSVHAAAFVNISGHIRHVQEDIGRHNAVDKLLGSLAMSETQISDGFILISSRCSYEIVEKAARLGIRAILSISSPTTFSLQKAKEANLSLYAQSKTGIVEL